MKDRFQNIRAGALKILMGLPALLTMLGGLSEERAATSRRPDRTGLWPDGGADCHRHDRLWGALYAVAAFLYGPSGKERDLRDKLRESWKAEIDARLASSQRKHGECEKDRDRLHDDFKEVRSRVARFERYPKAGKCPMRLPG